MNIISIAAEDERELLAALADIEQRGDTSNWEALETLDVLGKITWDFDAERWVVVADVLLVVSHYPAETTMNEIKCSCGREFARGTDRQRHMNAEERKTNRRRIAAITVEPEPEPVVEQHELTHFDATYYPQSEWVRTVTWNCSCGKSGTVSDGKRGATYKRARAAHKSHVTKSAS